MAREVINIQPTDVILLMFILSNYLLNIYIYMMYTSVLLPTSLRKFSHGGGSSEEAQCLLKVLAWSGRGF